MPTDIARYSIELFRREGEGIEQVIDRHADIKVARSIYQTSVKRYPGRLIIAPVANDPNVWSGRLPPLLQGFDAVPPLVTDIDLSMDDRFLYVSCWGTGEMRQYDVTDPRKLKLAGSVRIGGIARRSQHPSGKQYAGGPQMVEISRDGRRVYWTNSLYSTWDNQFYPDGIPGAEVMAIAGPNGGLELAQNYWVSFPDGYRAHQIRLEGGDCSTDSFCYPSA
jgi:methanethiol oxidase